MTLKPCIYCPFSPDCEIRQGKVAAVRGVGITTMTFRCKRLRDEYKPGDVVLIDLKCSESSREWTETVTATVMRRKTPYKLLVAFDPENNATEKQMGNFAPKRCRKTGERRSVCVHCGKPRGVEIELPDTAIGVTIPWHCRYSAGVYSPDGDEITPPLPLPCEYGDTA